MAVPLTWMPAYAHGGAFTAGKPIGVVVHSTESDDGPGSAEAIAGSGWFGGPKAGTSAHKIVDQNSICEGVKRNVIAWHVGPGGNGLYVGYEFCGRAGWSAAQWRAPEQLQMLRNAAPYIADDLRYCGAPARWLSLAQVAAKQPGLLTHNDVRLALGGTTHSDPGPNFPYAELLSYVQGGTPTPGGFLMALTDAQQQQIYDALIQGDGKGPGNNFAWLYNQMQPVLADIQAQLHGGMPKGQNNFHWVVAQILTALGQLDPAKPLAASDIAALIPADIAGQVADELAKRIAA